MWLSASQVGMRYLRVPTWYCSLSGICWLKAVDTHAHEGTDLPLCFTQRWSCPGVLNSSPQGLPSPFWLSSLDLQTSRQFFEFFFFFKIFFLTWTIFEVFIEFVTILLLFHVLVFWSWGMWISAPWLGIEPSSLHWEMKCSPWATRKVPCELLVSFQ